MDLSFKRLIEGLPGKAVQKNNENQGGGTNE
jgi:hypothetical protein